MLVYSGDIAFIVCFRYRAPELLFGSKIQTIAIDIWYVLIY